MSYIDTKYTLEDITPDQTVTKETKYDNSQDLELGMISNYMERGTELEVGDMLAFRDALTNKGYKLWKDFKIKKIQK